MPPSGNVCHNFPVTLTDSPDCAGIDSVIEAYRLVVHSNRSINQYPSIQFKAMTMIMDQRKKIM